MYCVGRFGLHADGGGNRRFQHVEGLVELRVSNYKRHQPADHVTERSGGERNDAVFVAIASDRVRLVRGRLERAGLDQFDGAHAAEPAHIADDGPGLLPVAGALLEVVAELLGAVAKIVFLDRVDDSDTSGTRNRVAGEGAPKSA